MSRFRIRVAVLCTVLASLGAAQVSLAGTGGQPGNRPNIVFILADDFSMNLVDYMKKAPTLGLKRMMDEGATFTNYFTSNSLCCPSRSTIFTGKYPHNTGVFTNTWNPAKGLVDGAFEAFQAYHNEQHTFAIALHNGGYKTAMMGKYLNDYLPWKPSPTPYQTWGWDEWDVAGDGYPEFSYDLNHNGQVVHYGINPEDYLTDVVSKAAQDFITANKTGPFFIEVATFAPHSPYRPAYRDETAYPSASLSKNPQPPYGVPAGPTAPDWIRDIPALTQPEKDAMDDAFRLRAQSVRAIDKMIGEIRALLRKLKIDKNTYVFFSADNGYHMGEYNFLPGKMTPFDVDINVPLVVVGPGIQPKMVTEIAQNVDLCPTFTELGASPAGTNPDGRSLVPLLQGTVPSWRKMALVEHHGPPDDPTDPDNEPHQRSSGKANPPNYEALRTDQYLYVEYYNAGPNVTEQSYYDLATDKNELNNTYKTLPPARKKELHEAIVKNVDCGKPTKPACWQVQQ